MIYIFRNDISYFFRHNKRILVTYLGVVLSYLGLQFLSKQVNYNTFYDALGLNVDANSGLLALIIFIFTVGVYIYISASIFTKDLKVGMDHIFLRMRAGNWFFYKWISIFLITFLLKGILYILTILLVGFGNIPGQLFLLFLSDIIYTSILQMTVVTLYTLTKRNPVYLLLFILLFMLVGRYFPICIVSTIPYWYMYAIVLGIISVGNFIWIRKSPVYLFE